MTFLKQMTRAAGIALAMLFVTGAGALAQTAVTITDLGTLGGNDSVAFAVNAHGDAVGVSSPAGTSASRATLWTGGTPQNLGILCDASCPAWASSYAYSINDDGQVVGFTATPNGDRAFLWQGGAMTALPPLPGDNASWAYDITRDGRTVGSSGGPNGRRAVIWVNGVPSSLGVLGSGSFAFSSAYGINEAGQIVGESSTASGRVHAFVWDNGVMTDLGAPAGAGNCAFSRSAALGINATGAISGWGYVGCVQRAAVWVNGVRTDLEALRGSTAFSATFLHSISDAGDIAGTAAVALEGCATYHAVLWRDGVATDLGTLGANPCLESWGYGLNNRGQVAGYVLLASGHRRAVIYSTEEPDTAAPALSLPGDLTAEATGPGGAVVAWDATAHDDRDGDVAVSCLPQSGTEFGLGIATVACSATDAAGNSASGSFTVTVADTTAPALGAVTPSHAVLWPPAQQMVTVTLSYGVTDLVSTPVCTISVDSDQPPGDRRGRPSASDWHVRDAHTVELRAERNPRGTQRTYTLTVSCADAAGNAVTQATTVVVPGRL